MGKKDEKNQRQAAVAYEAAVEKLQELCGDTLAVSIEEQTFPIRVVFWPNPQQSLFGNEIPNVNPDGEVNCMIVSVGISTIVKSNLNFKIDAKLLKKLIREAEKVGHLYYLAFRENADWAPVEEEEEED